MVLSPSANNGSGVAWLGCGACHRIVAVSVRSSNRLGTASIVLLTTVVVDFLLLLCVFSGYRSLLIATFDFHQTFSLGAKTGSEYLNNKKF